MLRHWNSNKTLTCTRGALLCKTSARSIGGRICCSRPQPGWRKSAACASFRGRMTQNMGTNQTSRPLGTRLRAGGTGGVMKYMLQLVNFARASSSRQNRSIGASERVISNSFVYCTFWKLSRPRVFDLLHDPFTLGLSTLMWNFCLWYNVT